MSTKDNIFIGLHIPKTAGTTLINLLRIQLDSPSFLECLGNTYSVDNQIDFIEEILDYTKIKVLFGHIVDQMYCSYFCNRQIYLFTILRNPIKRIVSHYNHINGGSTLNLEGFLKREETHNFMCRFIVSRLSYFLDDKDIHLPLHQKAIKILRSLNFICLTEEFDLMMNLLLQDMDIELKTSSITRHYVSNKNKKIDFLDLELIKKYNQEDLALYNYFLDARRQNPEAKNPLGFCHESYTKGLHKIFSTNFSKKAMLKKRFQTYVEEMETYIPNEKEEKLQREIFRTKQQLLNKVIKLGVLIDLKDDVTDINKYFLKKLLDLESILEDDIEKSKVS